MFILCFLPLCSLFVALGFVLLFSSSFVYLPFCCVLLSSWDLRCSSSEVSLVVWLCLFVHLLLLCACILIWRVTGCPPVFSALTLFDMLCSTPFVSWCLSLAILSYVWLCFLRPMSVLRFWRLELLHLCSVSALVFVSLTSRFFVFAVCWFLSSCDLFGCSPLLPIYALLWCFFCIPYVLVS